MLRIAASLSHVDEWCNIDDFYYYHHHYFFLKILKDLEFDQKCRHYAVKKIMTIEIRTSYSIFCKRNKDWDDPELMTL